MSKLSDKMKQLVEKRGGRPVANEPTVAVEAVIEYLTEKAMRVAAEGDEFWMPRRVVMNDIEDIEVGQERVLEVAEWWWTKERG